VADGDDRRDPCGKSNQRADEPHVSSTPPRQRRSVTIIRA
jgi:hypothetical protein